MRKFRDLLWTDFR